MQDAPWIKTFSAILAELPVIKDMSPDKRMGIAADITEAFQNKMLKVQLSREAPTALDLNRRREEFLQHVLLGSVVKEFPIQAEITIYFPVSWF